MNIKTIIKIVVSLVIVIPAVGGIGYYAINAENIPFESVCEKGHKKYTNLCENVGKRAKSIKNMTAINNADYGKIVGVAWRQRGSIISSSGQDQRYSASNSYYYIISGDKRGYYFLRIVSEIAAE